MNVPQRPHSAKLPDISRIPGASEVTGAAKSAAADMAADAVAPGLVGAHDAIKAVEDDPSNGTAPGGATAAKNGQPADPAKPPKPATTGLKADIANAVTGGGNAVPAGAKQSNRGVAMEIAAAAAKGAAQGAAGTPVVMAINAVKAAGVQLVKNKRTRKLLLGIVAAIVVVYMFVGIAAVSAIMSATGAINASNSITAQATVSKAGVSGENASTDIGLGDTYNIPWTIFTAMRIQTGAEPDAKAIAAAVRKQDPAGDNSSLDAGGVYEENQGSRVIRASSKTDVAAAKRVKDVYVAALSTLPGMDGATAERVFTQALGWWLGQSPSCPASAEQSTETSTALESLTAKGTKLSIAQLEIAKSVVSATKGVLATKKYPAADTVRAAEIAISVAIVETMLSNPDGGDRDSVGTFQQRDPWGSFAQRTNVTWSTGAFLRALLKTAQWNTLPAGEVAQTVQVSAFPDEYTKRGQESKAIVSTLWNSSPTAKVPADLDLTSVADAAAGVDPNKEGITCLQPDLGLWVAPFNGTPTVNDWFGSPTSACWPGCRKHDGVDFGVKSGDPVLAVSSGTVTYVMKTDGDGCGIQVHIQHDGASMRYCHLITVPLVNKGDVVVAGQEIGQAGNTGQSTGTHLHFDVTIGGRRVDPVVFMYSHGVDFRTLPLWSVSPYQGAL